MSRQTGVLILLLLALSAAPDVAQEGGITGTVTDETGAVVPGATVTLSGSDEGRVTQSDATGEYVFPAVSVGTDAVTAALSGFSAATLEGIVVADAPVEVRDITVSIASFGDTVVVSALRTEVRVVDAPVTASVVPAATLETTASTNVGELLRSVPGVNVVQLSARDVQVTSRQSTGPAANSQVVLMDGRSIYQHLPRLLRPGAVGHAARQPERHRADRGRPRAGVCQLGRERDDRRRQHHHQGTAQLGRYEGERERRLDRPRGRVDRRAGSRNGPLNKGRGRSLGPSPGQHPRVAESPHDGSPRSTKVGADPRRHQLTDRGAVAEVETLNEGRSRSPATLYRPGVTITPNYIAQRRPGPIPGPIPGDTADSIWRG